MISGGIISKSLFKCDINGTRLEDISHAFVGGRVRYRESSAGSAMTFEMELVGPEVVSSLAEFVTPFVTYQFDDGSTIERRLGVYVVAQPDAIVTQSTARLRYPCEDILAVARDATLGSVYKIPSGTNIAAAIADLLELVGITNVRLPRSTKTTGYKRAFSGDMTVLEAANSLCDAARWWHLSMALDGAVTTQPSRLLSQSQAVRTITNDDYIGAWTHRPTRGVVGNVVIVRRERSDQPTLIARRVNDDASSPISTFNIGREILYGGAPYEASDAEDQDDVDAIADRLIEEARSYERTVTVTVPPDPDLLGPRRVLELDLSTDSWDAYGRYWLREFALGLDPTSAPMELVLNRLVRFEAGEDVS
jgi:hypothetical protein